MKAKFEKRGGKCILWLDAQIPKFAKHALKHAYVKTLTSDSTVFETVEGIMLESSLDGSTRVIRTLPLSPVVHLAKNRIRRITR